MKGVKLRVVDLQAYFQRIGFVGDPEPTLETLKSLIWRQLCTIPFENLDVLAGKEVIVEPDALFAKLVNENRGGYCFENNGLLLGALEAIGFAVTPLSARVRIMAPDGPVTPLTHLTLKVVVEGEAYLADVGFGGFSPSVPLRFDTEEAQETPHNLYRLVGPVETKMLQIWIGGEWKDGYQLSGIAMPLADRILGNWFTSAHPKTHFRQLAFCSLGLEDGSRVGFLGNEFTHRKGDEVIENRVVDDQEDAQRLFAERFGLSIPENLQIPLNFQA